jgi:sugar lactone lactonase YvrE
VKSIDVTCIWNDDSIVGESPIWSPDEGLLYWVDIRRGRVQRFDPKTSRNEFVTIDDIVTSVNLKRGNGLILTLGKEFASMVQFDGQITRLGNPEPNLTGNRFNDAKCDRNGRLWAGTMGDKDWMSPTGSLYRFEGPGNVERCQPDVICSNGTGWSPDNRIMYYTESFRYAVFAYDFDIEAGKVLNRRVFFQLDPSGGEFPDGLTVDSEGFIWSAHVGTGRIVRYDPDGKPEMEVRLPVTRGTSCAFGGDSLDTLFITSARETLTPEMLQKEPLAGSLFACKPGVKGLSETAFIG